METELQDPFILIYEKKISSMKDLLPLLEQVARAGKPLLLIAEELEGRGARDRLAVVEVTILRAMLKPSGA